MKDKLEERFIVFLYRKTRKDGYLESEGLFLKRTTCGNPFCTAKQAAKTRKKEKEEREQAEKNLSSAYKAWNFERCE